MHVKQSIMITLMALEGKGDGSTFLQAIEGLVETDDALRLREVVKHLDELIASGFIEADGPYYESNENITINYLNAAISIDPSRLRVTEAGKVWLSNEGQKGLKTSESPFLTILTYAVTFLLGMASMYVLMGLK